VRPRPDPELLRLLGAVHDLVDERLPPGADARQLYGSAAAVAERVLPGPVGVAVAATLALAAHQRRNAGLGGCLGESHASLALAVLDAGREADAAAFDAALEQPGAGAG
jgi:hypothetical protein